MDIQILGAHALEAKGARLTSLLIDDVLAIDAGGLTSALSLSQGYLPCVIVIHIGNPYEEQIKGEIAQVAEELQADISLGYEDMKVVL